MRDRPTITSEPNKLRPSRNTALRQSKRVDSRTIAITNKILHLLLTTTLQFGNFRHHDIFQLVLVVDDALSQWIITSA